MAKPHISATGGDLGSLRLRLPFFKELNMAEGVGGGDSPYRSDAVGGVHHFFIRIQDEIGRVDDLSSLFPKGAYLLGVPGNFEPIRNWKR